MSNCPRASTFPIGGPTPTVTSSASGHRPTSLTTRTSSENGSICSGETARTSFADEAQTCFNILIILRHDTQHLISKRNQNLAALESTSGLTKDAASSKSALLACINESITAATRSITELGPSLDRYRWPAAARPTTPESQWRSFTLAFKARRPRKESFSAAAVGPQVAEPGDCSLSLEEIFDWTLALTAQHTAVIVATDRLAMFLESGIANVSEEEKIRRDARQSWWEQGRGGFENVGLIQSLLAKPRRTFKDGTKENADSTAVTAQTQKQSTPSVVEAESVISTPNMGTDEWRSEAQHMEASTTATATSTPKGLTARPRHQRTGSLQEEEAISVRQLCTDPVVYSSVDPTSTTDAKISRMETFGSEKPATALSRCGSSRQTSRVARPDLPTSTFLVDGVSHQGRKSAATPTIIPLGDDYPPVETSHDADVQLLTVPFVTTPSTEKDDTPQTDPDDQPSNMETTQGLASRISTDFEKQYKPYTPVDHHFTSRFTQRALTLPLSTSPQPVGRGLDSMIITPDQGAQNFALRVSPIEAKSRVSVTPVIEGPDHSVVSPLGTDSSSIGQEAMRGVSPITITDSQSGAYSLNEVGTLDGHEPWLEYMSKKQQVVSARWSLRRARTSQV